MTSDQLLTVTVANDARSLQGHSSVELWFEASSRLPVTAKRFHVMGFQGVGVVSSEAIYDRTGAQRMLADFTQFSQVRDTLLQSAGSFTLQVRDLRTGAVLFLNDPLGGGFIFHAVRSETQVVSSSLSSLKTVLLSCGQSLDRDVFFEIANFATGTAVYGADTPYRGVKSLRPGFGVQVGVDGVVSELDYGVLSQMDWLATLPYEDLVRLGTSVVQRNISAILDVRGLHKFMDISGGFDSRLVLAGVASLGRTDEVSLSSIRASPEWEYAEGLANTTGMALTNRRFNGAGVTSGANAFDRALSGARSSGGFIDFGLDPKSMALPIATMQGGYGETFRTFSNFHYSNDKDFDPRLLSEQLWAWKRIDRTHRDGEPLMSDASRDQLTNSLADVFARVRADGAPNDYVSSATYLETRNRHWIGQKSYWWSSKQLRFDPLYNLPLIVAARSLSFWERRANFVGLDAMQELAPELLSLPFYNVGVVGKRYRSERSLRPPRKFATSGKRTARFSPPSIPPWNLDGSAEFSALDRDIGASLSVSRSAVNAVRVWGQRAQEAILSHSDLAQYFNETVLSEYLTTIPTDRDGVLAAEKLISCVFRTGVLRPEFVGLRDEVLLR